MNKTAIVPNLITVTMDSEAQEKAFINAEHISFIVRPRIEGARTVITTIWGGRIFVEDTVEEILSRIYRRDVCGNNLTLGKMYRREQV